MTNCDCDQHEKKNLTNNKHQLQRMTSKTELMDTEKMNVDLFTMNKEIGFSKIDDKTRGNTKHLNNRKPEPTKKRSALKDISEVGMDLYTRNINDKAFREKMKKLKNGKLQKEQKLSSKTELKEANEVEVDLYAKGLNCQNSAKTNTLKKCNRKNTERRPSETELMETLEIDVDLFTQISGTDSPEAASKSKESETELRESREIEMDLYSKKINHTFVDIRRPSLIGGLPSFNVNNSSWLFAKHCNITLPAGQCQNNSNNIISLYSRPM